MPTRWQLSLEDYTDTATYVLGADREALTAIPRLALAESALHAPFASFGGTEAYLNLIEQAAVLLQHLANNHPLPDANKRARSCSRPDSSTPTAWHGDAQTPRPMQAPSSASPPARRITSWRGLDPKRTREKGDEPPTIS